MNGQQLNKPIVGIASGPNDDAYWLVGGDGGTFNFGGIPQYGSTRARASTTASSASPRVPTNKASI